MAADHVSENRQERDATNNIKHFSLLADGEDLVTKAPQKTTSKVDKPDKKEGTGVLY